MPKKLAVFVVFSLLAVAASAQERDRINIFPITEAVYYGQRAPELGLGLAVTYGDGISIGARAAYMLPLNEEDFTAFEIVFSFRAFFLDLSAARGLFAQLDIGAVIFSTQGELTLPEEGGTVSAGLSAGYRFLLGKYFFIEPYLRVGFPYGFGAGLSAGVRL